MFSKFTAGTGFLITDNGYLVSNYHVVKDATKVRLLTGAGLIDAKVVQVDEANDLALLKADGKFSPLPISSSRSAQLGGTVATVGFADIGLQGFAPKVLAHGHHGGNRWWEVELRPGDDPRYFQISAVFADGHHAAGQMAGRASSAGG
ncbi:MAG: serine protease [Verrucomicrobiia bacterium]